MEGVGYDFIGKSTTIENVGENMKRSTIQVAVILYGLLTLLGLVYLSNIIHHPMRFKILFKLFFVFYMFSCISGCIFACFRIHYDNYKYRDVYMIINRTLEFSMQVTVLLHMMRYFTENIVNLKKKVVHKYIVGCIITFFIYFSFFVVGLYIKMSIDMFIISEMIYVLTNTLISLLCILSCKHVIFKLKTLYHKVCCSMRLEVARSVALLVTNTSILVVVLVCRILTSLYFLLSNHSTKRFMDIMTLYLPVFFNIILLSLVTDYSPKYKLSTMMKKWKSLSFLKKWGLGRDIYGAIDDLTYIRGCECRFGEHEETAHKYHYDETLSSRTVNGPTNSLRSLFSTKKSQQQRSSGTVTQDSSDAEEVQSGDEIDDIDMPCVNEGPDCQKATVIEKQPSEKNHGTEKNKGNLKVEDRCGKPLNCSISLAVYIELLEENSFFSRLNGLFIRCSYRYIDDDPNSLLPKSYQHSGDTEFVPVTQCMNGFMFNCCLTIPIPTNDSKFTSTTPTARLQEFLTSHSSKKTSSHLITDIELMFECFSTNSTSSLNYSTDKGNRVLFTERLSLNTLLNSQNALFLRNSVFSRLSPRATRVSHINPKYSSEDGELGSLSKSSYIITERRNSYLSDMENHSLRDSCELVEESSVSPKEMDHGLATDRLDLDQIPDFSPINTHYDGYASCPNSVQITPNNYGAINHLKNPKTPDGMHQHFFEEGESLSNLRYSSVSYDIMEPISDISLSCTAYSYGDRSSTTPIARKEIHSYPYLFGCYLVAIRPYKEGRFFKKEYVFDKTGANGKNIFVPSMNHNSNSFLTHVTELMNETDLTFDVPSAYCEFSLSLWDHELEDSQSVYEQQDKLANARMKKEEFDTMDALLRQSRDFVARQHFYEKKIHSIKDHMELLKKNIHRDSKTVKKFTFKPSTMKTVDICSCLPTNLHINDIWIQRRSYQEFNSLEDLFKSLMPPRKPAYSSMSCGTPNAYYYGFSHGSLYSLLTEFYLKASTTKGFFEKDEAILNSLQIRKRFDLASSQAMSILVTSFCSDLLHLIQGLTEGLYDSHIFQQWRNHGYPMMYGSLLSMYNKEMTMILDSFCAVYALRGVQFSIQFRKSSELSVSMLPTMKVSHHHLVITIVVSCLPQHLHMKEFEMFKGNKLHGSLISVVPLFFSIGVDMNQTLVDLINQHNILIEHNINNICYRDIVDYANDVGNKGSGLKDLPDLYNSSRSHAAQTINITKLMSYVAENYNCDSPMDITDISCYNPDLSEQLSYLKEVLQETAIKNMNLIQSFIQIAEQLHSGITVMCKSGKDRTGMLITLREAYLLDKSNFICKSEFQTYLDLLRGYGTRIRNAEKNTGVPQYMFNTLQNRFLPQQLKAPKCNRGHGLT